MTAIEAGAHRWHLLLADALPCAHLEDQPAGQARLCRQPAHIGIITPVGDGIWELLPVCQRHFQEAAHAWGARDAHALRSWIHAQSPPEQLGI